MRIEIDFIILINKKKGHIPNIFNAEIFMNVISFIIILVVVLISLDEISIEELFQKDEDGIINILYYSIFYLCFSMIIPLIFSLIKLFLFIVNRFKHYTFYRYRILFVSIPIIFILVDLILAFIFKKINFNLNNPDLFFINSIFLSLVIMIICYPVVLKREYQYYNYFEKEPHTLIDELHEN